MLANSRWNTTFLCMNSFFIEKPNNTYFPKRERQCALNIYRSNYTETTMGITIIPVPTNILHVVKKIERNRQNPQECTLLTSPPHYLRNHVSQFHIPLLKHISFQFSQHCSHNNTKYCITFSHITSSIAY